MAHRETAPYRPQDHHEVTQLIQAMNAHQKKNKGGRGGGGGFSCRKSTFQLPNGRTVDSWKMQDWDYKKPNLPTYSRGLFTYKTLDGKDEIAVRGYDKFFNHGEVRKTEWSNVKKNTRGPYELSVKENGCIIFVSGLDDGTLLVCSKHSTGARGDVELSHAMAGERWVEKHVQAVGKTKEDLAKKLREMNVTLVAELCDDSFEEHVLEYGPDTAGLYVHGINLNVPEFATYPGPLVDKFADEWGMRKVVYVMEDDIEQVKSFLDKVAETGNYAGRDTEGFVIRCQARETRDSPFEDWFFKYKFEEPYLMYRQWRECTKALIAGKPPRYKKHKVITEAYLQYARSRFVREPGLSKAYNQNHGIIKLRDDFLKERGVTGAQVIKEESQNGEVESHDVTRNVVLVPVATIGCGKTTVAMALVKLFNWGHFQNDNVTTRKGRPQVFAENICSLMMTHPVVIADRNNHQTREREQLIADVSKRAPEARFVALQYDHDRANYDNIRRATRERVLARGDNHQTIQAASTGQDEILEIMEGFMHRFQQIDTSDSPDNAFDFVINMDPVASSRENLEVVVEKLYQEYPKLFPGEMPSAEDLDAAIEAALNDYKPDVKMDLSRSGGGNKGQNKQLRQTQNRQAHANGSAKKPKVAKVEYFSVRLPSQRINTILDAVFTDQDPTLSKFYNQLKHSRRVQPEFHVTLIHKASASQHSDYWDKLHRLWETRTGADFAKATLEPELGTCQVQLERLVWDGRVLCVVTRLDGKAEDEEVEFATVNPIAHVTVGTANQGIKPKESNDLLKRWLDGGSGGETGVWEVAVPGHVVLKGSVKAVISR